MADDSEETLHALTKGYEAKTWFRKYMHSWQYHKAQTGWNLPQGIAIGKQSFFGKVLPVPGLIITTILSAAILRGIDQPPFIDNDFYDFVSTHRSSVQAILSLLTSVFSFAHLYVLTSVINFSTRILLTQWAPTLDRLKLWRALSNRSIDLALPFTFLAPLAVVWALTLGVGSLWTGALTPNLVSRNITANIPVPFYAPDPDGQAWNQTWTPIASHNVIRSPLGTFSYTPAYDRGTSMINTAAGVIYDKDAPDGKRPRSDKTGYAYRTRSYGVGSSLGLAQSFSEGYRHPMMYQYQEIGYNASVVCTFNASSQWGITPPTDVDKDELPYIPNIYWAKGATPDGALFWQLQYSAIDDSNVVSMNAHPNLNSTGKGTVMIATGNTQGGPYLTLNQTQCSVAFIPTLFDISVNLSSSVITVDRADSAPDMDPTAQPNATFTAWRCHTLLDTLASLENSTTGCGNYTAQGQPGLGNIATRALRQLNDLSVLDTSLHTSSLGEMFLSLIQNEIVYYANTTKYQDWNITDFSSDISSPDTTTNASITEYSIEQGLKSLIDDSLLAFASAQLVLHYENSSQVTTGSLTVGAVLVGTRGYVYSLFVFNLLLILTLIEEMFRTRCWANLPLFDYNDLKGVIVASSMGGKELANMVVAAHEKSESVWVADPHDKTASGIRVQLKCRDHGSVELVSVQDREYELVDVDSNVKYG
ncbi:MAG: hypothetical protein ASARMPRED_005446 [Alectoria sarmentosa]|nr:MAG: hypothetical protein ASARMPRED_005446 [Alectoria sarmentosa]